MTAVGPIHGAFATLADLGVPVADRLEDVPAADIVFWPENGYLLRRTPSGVIVGVTGYLFTWGLARGIDQFGYSERWCYERLEDAIANLHVLGDEGEPVGFIRKVGRP